MFFRDGRQEDQRQVPRRLPGHETSESGSETCWLAVKERNLSYHNMDIYQILWLLDYGNLLQVPA